MLQTGGEGLTLVARQRPERFGDANLIHFFRQRQNTTGRSLLGALLGAWLLLFLSPCAMAAMAAEPAVAHADDGAVVCHECQASCQEGQACADSRLAPLSESVPVSQQDARMPFLPAAEVSLPEPPRYSMVLLPHPPPDSNGVKQHPALSFRVLRI